MQFALALLFALAVFGLRVLPHPWNVAPVAAAMLCAGAFLPRRLSILAPLLGSLAADAVIGFDHWQITSVIYGTYLFTWGLGRLCRMPKSSHLVERVATLGTGSLAGSVAFFLSTNWAVWVWSGLYPASWSGLWQSYIMAIPFFKNSLVGDLFFTFVFFTLVACASPVYGRFRQLLRFPRPSVL